MCRMLGYWGESLAANQLLEFPEHSLEKQSYAPKLLKEAVVNADGWGLGWYIDGETAPCLYRSTLPIWADVNRAHLGRAIRSRVLLAAVRSATDSLSVSHANTQPFSSNRLVFLHNGFIHRFKHTIMRNLREVLDDSHYTSLCGTTDSEHVLALISQNYDRHLAARERLPLLEAVRAALVQVRELVSSTKTVALLCIIVSDGASMVAVRQAYHAEPPSLYWRRHSGGAGAIVASEPLDALPLWQEMRPGEAIITTEGDTQSVAIA